MVFSFVSPLAALPLFTEQAQHQFISSNVLNDFNSFNKSASKLAFDVMESQKSLSVNNGQQ